MFFHFIEATFLITINLHPPTVEGTVLVSCRKAALLTFLNIVIFSSSVVYYSVYINFCVYSSTSQYMCVPCLMINPDLTFIIQ